MIKYKILTLFLTTLLLLVTAVSYIRVSVPCEQCGEPAYHENVFARVAAGFDTTFLHFECVGDYLRDHPLKRDERGCIIPDLN